MNDTNWEFVKEALRLFYKRKQIAIIRMIRNFFQWNKCFSGLCIALYREFKFNQLYAYCWINKKYTHEKCNVLCD